MVANLIVIPLIGVGVGLGLLTVIVYFFWEPATTILNATNWLVLKGAIWCANERIRRQDYSQRLPARWNGMRSGQTRAILSILQKRN